MPNRPSVTGNKEYDFYLQHYEDIEALSKVIQIAEIGIPQWVEGEIKDIIRSMQHKGFFDDFNLIYHEDGVWWSDPKYYDEEKGKGVYFQFEQGWEFKNITNPNEPISLCLAIDSDKRNKNLTVTWQRYLGKFQKGLRKKNIFVYTDDETYLAEYSFWEFTNINVLRNQAFSSKRIENAVKDFTLSLLPLIRKKKP